MNPLPPETTTELPPQLRWVYEKPLGWPGKPEAKPKGALSARVATVKP